MSVLLELTKNEKNEFGGGKYIKKLGDSFFCDYMIQHICGGFCKKKLRNSKHFMKFMSHIY